jgi:hypothetical protein
MSDFWSPKEDRKARKPYRCVWCGEGIAKGDMHAVQSGNFDGEFQRNRWHPECFDGADWEDVQDGFTLYSGERPKPASEEAI